METNDAQRWNLADLYASPADVRLRDDLGRARSEGDAFAQKYRGKVAGMSAPALAEALRAYEALVDLAYRPQLYASLLFSCQTDDEPAQALMAQTREATTDAFNRVRFFDVELKTLPQPAFDQLLAAPALMPYRHYLAALRRFAPHTLSEAEERLAERKNLTGRAAFDQLFTEVSARIRIPWEEDGIKRELNVEEVRALRSSPDRHVRERAVEGLMSAFEAQSHVLTFCFNTLFQDHRLDVEQRGFKSLTEPTYLEDELSEPLVESLMRETEQSYGLAQRYLKLKARALELPDFSSHDVLAPIAQTERKVGYDEGRQLVVDAFGAFDGRFADIVKQFMDHRWIDVLPRPGKRDGAFCSGMLPSLHPYVFLNYNHRIEDVSTLAHELGHGIHFYLSRKQTPLNFWSTTPLAETASVFGELLLMKRLMETEKDVRARRSLLALRIEDIVATVFNQVAYTRWEQKAHARRAEGVVPAEEYAKLWMDERKRLWGDAVRTFPRDRWGWISIGHFVHYRFYCYSYAFGQLLVLALFRKYEEEGKAFIPKYIELLSSGCSDSPQALLAKVGIDLMAPGFWSQGFKILEGLIDDFEKLLPT
jgi:oligoendopeptidase F